MEDDEYTSHQNLNRENKGTSWADFSPSQMFKYDLKPKRVEQRTVMLLGHTGSGKSSIAFHMTGDPKHKISDGFESETEKTLLTTISYPGEDVIHSITIVDTPGLSDTKKDVSNFLQHQKIFETVDYDLSRIHLFVIVMSRTKITDEERKDILEILNMFKGGPQAIKPYVVLAISQSETKEDEDIIENIKKSETMMRDIVPNLRGDLEGIIPIGFPDLNGVKNEHLIKFYKEKIEESKKKIFQLIISSDEKGRHREDLVDSKSLNELKVRLEEAEKCQQELEEVKRQLIAKNVQDIEHEKFKQELEEVKQQLQRKIKEKEEMVTTLIKSLSPTKAFILLASGLGLGGMLYLKKG